MLGKVGLLFYQDIYNLDFSKEKRTRLLKTNTAHERNNSECKYSFVLPLINDVNTSVAQIEKSIVMLETSGDPWLIAR